MSATGGFSAAISNGISSAWRRLSGVGAPDMISLQKQAHIKVCPVHLFTGQNAGRNAILLAAKAPYVCSQGRRSARTDLAPNALVNESAGLLFAL